MRKAEFSRYHADRVRLDFTDPRTSLPSLTRPPMLDGTSVVTEKPATCQRPVTVTGRFDESPDNRLCDVNELSPGTYLLSGPAYTGKHDFALQFLTDTSAGTGLAISPNDSGNDVASRIAAYTHDGESVAPEAEQTWEQDQLFDRYGIVDCQPPTESDDTELSGVRPAPSPGALTKVGIRTTNQLQRLDAEDSGAVRLVHLSLSTTLMYTSPRTVVEFVATLRSQLDELDGTGLLVLNAKMHDDQVVNELAEVVDGVVRLRDEVE